MMHPAFKLRESATPEIIELLSSVTLGTNGAHYAHLDTEETIKEADNPLFLSLERNEKVLGNVTFCKREHDWYVRYFAFDRMLQSGGKTKSRKNANSMLKRELCEFFSRVFEMQADKPTVKSFYAYIDPANEKSLWMSETFGFQSIAKIATQTFSRVRPKSSPKLEITKDWKEIESFIKSEYADYNYYDTTHLRKPPYYVLKSDDGEIIACAKTYRASWKIERLPGRFGGILTKIIPFIPGLRKIIRPSNHTFVVPEAVWVKENDAAILSQFFEAILAKEQLNLIIWWTDEEARLYQFVEQKLNWGILNRLIGVSKANLVVLNNPNVPTRMNSNPFYTIGFDFI